MADKQDIREDQMTLTDNVDYVRALKDNNSVLTRPSDLMKQGGISYRVLILSPEEQYELIFDSGLIMIQNTSISEEKAVATLCGSGNGTVIVPSNSINFFSEVQGKVCVFNNSTKYVVKNKMNLSVGIKLTFIR